MPGLRIPYKCILVLTSLAALARPITGHGDTIVLTPVKDNTLFSTSTTSNGAGDAVFSGRTGNGISQRAVLAFDISGDVPPGSTIDRAALSLTVIRTNSGPQLHAVYRIIKDWGEGKSNGSGGSGAPATDGDATWLHTFFPAEFWDVEGGDFDPDLRSSTTVMGEGSTATWDSTAEMVADVQNWLDHSESNFGWLIMGNEDPNTTSKKFASRQNDTEELRPKLEIEFTLPSCTADLDASGSVDLGDILAVFNAWGNVGGPEDLDQSGVVDMGDALVVLGNWGAC